MKELSLATIEWIIYKSPSHLRKSHFSTKPEYDILLNNIYVLFKRAILPIKDKSIITLLEGFRVYLMKIMVKKKESVNMWNGEIKSRVKMIV